ncbi:MAG: CbiX/SirB N-terminal domain-containing protein [Gemmobacter sp.]|nr:CbiX/SirB N-terminal domain-containing protein [Gemmobacter sp.]
MTSSQSALIVAHGSPADPAPHEAALQALAQAVNALMPGWTVRGATLAAPGALEAALSCLDAPLIYPFFMAEGWFTGREHPRRLRVSGAETARQVSPFGVDPALPDLMARVATEGARAAGMDPVTATLVLAAHGSKISRTSSDSTTAMARALSTRTTFKKITCGFVEEAPFLTDAACGLGPAVCLPFFALRAGHVLDDVPKALAEAGFDGPLLPEIGAHPDVPSLICAALLRG